MQLGSGTRTRGGEGMKDRHPDICTEELGSAGLCTLPAIPTTAVPGDLSEFILYSPGGIAGVV